MFLKTSIIMCNNGYFVDFVLAILMHMAYSFHFLAFQVNRSLLEVEQITGNPRDN